MKIEIARPPNFDAIAKKFSLRKGVIFTYGGVIYNPDAVNITPQLFAHEQIHAAQQADHAEEWWAQYLVDPSFRYSEELAAHRMEYIVATQGVKDPNQRARLLNSIAQRFASPIYKLHVPLSVARKDIASVQRN